NPPELVKHHQTPIITKPLFVYEKLDMTTPLKTSKKKESLGDFIERNVKENLYYSETEDLPPLMRFQNNSLYEKGKKYQKILHEKISSEVTLRFDLDSKDTYTLDELRKLRKFNPDFSRPKAFKLDISDSNITDDELKSIIKS